MSLIAVGRRGRSKAAFASRSAEPLPFLALLACLGCLSPLASEAREALHADLILTHAKVWTGDKSHPRAEAVAVSGERILAVGTDAEVALLRGPSTKVIDAGGHLVVPGFNDSHLHFMSGGENLDRVQLVDASSTEEFVRRIAARAHQTPPGEWILGGDWDETKWPGSALPTKELVDRVTGDHPLFLDRYDGHAALANSKALALGHVTADTKDPAGGLIVREKDGAPTGVLKDAARGLVSHAIPPPTHDQRLRAARRALGYAASLGVTSAQDMASELEDVAVYAELAEAGELTTRLYEAPLEFDAPSLFRVGLRRAFGTATLRLGAVKGFADGSIGSRTAYLFEPFTDEPANRGLLSREMHPPEAMRDRILEADAHGLQICIHAIGDRAISMVLDLYAEIERAHGYHDQRFRIEHAQHVAPKDFDRFASLHVIASMQPYHAIDDGRWVETRIGHERARSSYAWRSVLDHGAALAFGTDWSVAPLNPLLGLYAAVTRATLDGRHPEGWIPEERITMEEAVSAYTRGSAYAEFQDTDKGTLEPGKLADMVVLSDDIFEIRPESVKDVTVLQTVMGGRVVFTRPSPGPGH
jgi:predicted amidohydrolase YtcJ